MPKKHPNTVRWGGPGASHEDRTKPVPEPPPAQPLGATSTNPRVSRVSGGGGERDEKHSHVDALRSSKSHATDSPSPTNSTDWRKNRSRRDRQAEVELRRRLGETRSFDEAHGDPGSPDAPDAGEGTPVRVTFEGVGAGGTIVAAEAERRVRQAIARFDRNLSEVDVFLVDTGGQGSPGIRSCTIQAMPHRGPVAAATASGRDMDEAVTAAVLELVRRLTEAFPAAAPGADQGSSAKT